MGLCCCDKCWERPCVCGYEAAEAKRFRTEFYASYGCKPPEEEDDKRRKDIQPQAPLP